MLTADPFDKIARTSRAEAYMSKGDLDKALDDCNMALVIDDNYSQAYMLRSLVHTFKGNYREGRADLNRVLKLAPNDPGLKQLDAILKEKGF